ncbi:hypothetical protein JMG10_07595 [Nostoc ellipsosporum NOK]|nr:hypothetical protein [Nostoc ellipsosporum NOK]
MEKYIKDILNEIDRAIKDFQDVIPGIQKIMLEELQPLIKELGIKNGRILNDVQNLRLIGEIKNKLEKIVIQAKYKKAVKDFIASFETISTLNAAYFAAFNAKYTPAQTLPIIKRLAVEQTINSLVGQGMRVSVIDKVTKIVVDNITSGGQYSSFQEQLRDYIVGSERAEGGMERYTKQITTDAIHQYNAQYQEITAQDLHFNWGRYVGSNIATSREFCIRLTEKQWVHRSELPTIIHGDIDGHTCRLSKYTGLPLGMIPGTDADNFKVRRGGYNCGHQFFWTPDSGVPKDLREKFASAGKDGEKK